MKIKTIRNELATRLNSYRNVYHKQPMSYMKNLGMGYISKDNDKPFNGWGSDSLKYTNGITIKG